MVERASAGAPDEPADGPLWIDGMWWDVDAWLGPLIALDDDSAPADDGAPAEDAQQAPAERALDLREEIARLEEDGNPTALLPSTG